MQSQPKPTLYFADCHTKIGGVPGMDDHVIRGTGDLTIFQQEEENLSGHLTTNEINFNFRSHPIKRWENLVSCKCLKSTW